MEEEELYVTAKAAKDLEKSRIPRQYLTQRALGTIVVASDALQCKVESIADLLGAAASLVDRPLPINSISWKDHHPADGIHGSAEVF